MSEFVFDPLPTPFVPTTDGQKFPVRRIFCVGQNYADHVKEMGGDVRTSSPIFFTKPADAVICPTVTTPSVVYPPATDNLHFEAEIVLALGKAGEAVSEDTAMDLVYGIAMGCDLTRRDLQKQAKEKKAPWDTAKGFDQGAVMAAIRPGNDLPDDFAFSLSVNGKQKQQAKVAQMIFSPSRIISDLSRLFKLLPGDLIYTGTPEGVGAIVPGDHVEIIGDGLPPLNFTITET